MRHWSASIARSDGACGFYSTLLDKIRPAQPAGSCKAPPLSRRIVPFASGSGVGPHMRVIDRYVFRQVTTSFLACLLILTALIWLTQALRDFDILTAQGQTLLIFLIMTSLGDPVPGRDNRAGRLLHRRRLDAEPSQRRFGARGDERGGAVGAPPDAALPGDGAHRVHPGRRDHHLCPARQHARIALLAHAGQGGPDQQDRPRGAVHHGGRRHHLPHPGASQQWGAPRHLRSGCPRQGPDAHLHRRARPDRRIRRAARS